MLLRGATGTGGGVRTYTAAEVLVGAELLALDSSSEVRKASAGLSGGLYRVIGVSLGAAAASAPVLVSTTHGEVVAMRFASAPAAASNGSQVWLSAAAGVATLSPPVSAGNAVAPVGILEGADGVTLTPDVIFKTDREVRIET